MSNTPIYDSIIADASSLYNLPTNVLHNLIAAESSFNPDAVSSTGAQGLTQLMPTTAASLGVDDPFDPSQSIYGGAAYLSSLIKQFDGDVTKGLEAYNAGPTAVINNNVPKSSVNYAANILSGTQPQASANTAQQTGSVLGMAVQDAINPGSLASQQANLGTAIPNPIADAGSFIHNFLTFSNPINFVTVVIGMILLLVGGLMFVFPNAIPTGIRKAKQAVPILGATV
jgi:transglycosylase-like protein with SLT domain